MEVNESSPTGEQPAPATADGASVYSPARRELSRFRRLWTGPTASWILLAVAAGGLLLAWLAHLGIPASFATEDFRARAFMVASTAFVLLALIKVPQWQTADLPGTDFERFNAENEARKTFAQIIGGVGLVAGLYLTSLQVRDTQRAAADNAALTRDGQITDRYIKAVQQLGSTDPQSTSVRIGAIFALERIARESKTDYWPIMELLSAYVRNRSGPPLTAEERQRLTGLKETMPFVGKAELAEATMPKTGRSYEVVRDNFMDNTPWAWPNEPAPEDVQAAMTVLGRRRLDYEDSAWHRLNLRFANLRGLDLRSAHLEGADLEGANLEATDLAGACLCGVHLRNTLMNETVLENADLRRADLTGAILLNNRTHGADIREAIVEGILAPGHENNKKYSGFENADARGAMIDRGTIPLSGAVEIPEDGPQTSPDRPYPSARASEHCLLRSSQIWLEASSK